MEAEESVLTSVVQGLGSQGRTAWSNHFQLAVGGFDFAAAAAGRAPV